MVPQPGCVGPRLGIHCHSWPNARVISSPFQCSALKGIILIGIVDHNYNKCKAVETVLSKLICQSVDFSPKKEQPRYDHEQTFCLDYLLKIISVPETFIFLPPENSPE